MAQGIRFVFYFGLKAFFENRAYCRSLIHLYAPDGEKYKPTITPTPGFSPTADAEHLKRAMRGLGTFLHACFYLTFLKEEESAVVLLSSSKSIN